MSESNLRVLVTGGASGIGLAIAKEFLRSKARVWMCDVDPSALRGAIAGNPGLRGSIADVSAFSDVEPTVIEMTRAFGGIDVLINNAGVAGPTASTEAVSADDWKRCLDVNINGMFYCCKLVIPLMKSQRSGVILNISTANVRTGLPGRTPYVVSKYAVHGLTANLARELGPHGIRCNAILPGPIDNPRGRALIKQAAQEHGVSLQEAERSALSYVSLRSWIDPSEVGRMAVFLASKAARHVTGQFVGVCGNVEWDA